MDVEVNQHPKSEIDGKACHVALYFSTRHALEQRMSGSH